MIAPTPEQMRALANDAHESILAMVAQIENEWGSGTGIDALRLKGDEDVLLADAVSTALRTAADQLEAVRAWLRGQDSAEWETVDLEALDAIRNPVTASQEDRDD